MNTQQAIPQIPAMQLAKVGEKRRKKGGALPWFGGSGTAVRSGGGSSVRSPASQASPRSRSGSLCSLARWASAPITLARA